MSEPNWPTAELDTLGRLRVIAAATPGATVTEIVLPEPLAEVWSMAADLEAVLPRWLLPDIRSLRVISTDGPRSRAVIVGHSGFRARVDIVLRPGWCLMQSRFLVGGMAATEAGDGTRFAVMGALHGGLAALNRPLRSLSRRSGARAANRFADLVAQR